MIEPGYPTDDDRRGFDAHAERRPGDRSPFNRSDTSPDPEAAGTGQITGCRGRRDGREGPAFALEGSG